MGSNFPKILTSKKKKHKKRRRVHEKKDSCSASFRSAEVCFKIDFPDNYLFTYKFISGKGMFFFGTIASLFLHKHRDDMVHVTVLGRGSGGPPPENFWLKWCKIV